MIPTGQDSLNTRSTLRSEARATLIIRCAKAAEALGDVSRLPFSMKVLLENLLRFEDGVTVTRDDLQAMVDWQKERRINREIQYRPARVLMQDFTGVPAVVDLAAMRDAMTAARRRSAEDQSAGAGPPGHRPQRDGRRVRHAQGVREERRARISAQRRALRVPQMGQPGVRQFQGRAAGHRHLPPGQPRAYRPSACGPARTRTARRSPIPTRWSAPTATRRWSTASACSAGASAGSRPRRRCSASRSAC